MIDIATEEIATPFHVNDNLLTMNEDTAIEMTGNENQVHQIDENLHLNRQPESAEKNLTSNRRTPGRVPKQRALLQTQVENQAKFHETTKDFQKKIIKNRKR